jgi:demethylmenaquinone methyltransferase/2-methoxy-6-polyprenyl-1,4-benzoquinol methylase
MWNRPVPALLTERIGPTGAVVGVDQSPDMLAVARHRIGAHGWTNVTLIESAVEEVELPMKVDAALFCAHPRCPAVRGGAEQVFSHLGPDAWSAPSEANGHRSGWWQSERPTDVHAL